MKKWDEALEAYGQAQTIYPDNADLQKHLQSVKTAKADALRADADAEIVRAEVADLTKQAQRLLDLKKPGEATKLLEIAISKIPDDPTALYLSGLCNGELGRVDEELGQLERLRRLRPEVVEAHLALANLRHVRDDPAGALESYSAALESYNYGVRNLLDVTNAQKVLARARSTDIEARTQVLAALATLAFRTGDAIQAKTRRTRPGHCSFP